MFFHPCLEVHLSLSGILTVKNNLNTEVVQILSCLTKRAYILDFEGFFVLCNQNTYIPLLAHRDFFLCLVYDVLLPEREQAQLVICLRKEIIFGVLWGFFWETLGILMGDT